MWGCCENMCLQIGDYSLKSHMFSIEMGGCDIVLGVEWLCTLGHRHHGFQGVIHELPAVGHCYTFQGITTGYLKIVSSHHM
jgi:hypothetical protein